MPKTSEYYLKKLIDQIIEHAKQEHKQQHLEFNDLFEKYIRIFYSQVSYFDLEDRFVGDLYQIALVNWEMLLNRGSDEVKLHIYNSGENERRSTRIAILCQDASFLVDTIRMKINKLDISPLLIIHMGGVEVDRSPSGDLLGLDFNRKISTLESVEAPIYVEIDYQTNTDNFLKIEEHLRRVIDDVLLTVRDWKLMSGRMNDTIESLVSDDSSKSSADIKESVAFLRWLLDDHFIFLGARDYSVVEEDGESCLVLNKGSGLGVLSREESSTVKRKFSELPKKAIKQMLSGDRLLIKSKSNTLSTVHRSGYTDYIGIKIFDDNGKLIGERRFIGLLTSLAYQSSPDDIPFLRGKVSAVLKKSGFRQNSHAEKDLVSILSTLPRDDLIQAPVSQLYRMSMGILHMQERRRIKLFIREDNYGRFFSCLVYIPRDKFTTTLLQSIQSILVEKLNGIEVTFSTHFSVSVLVRLDFIIRVDHKKAVKVHRKVIEQLLVDAGKSWQERLFESASLNSFEHHKEYYMEKYGSFFIGSYKEHVKPENAIKDMLNIEKLSESMPMVIDCLSTDSNNPGLLTVKIYNLDSAIALSDALPIFEHMGCRVLEEHPFDCQFADGSHVWISEFTMECLGSVNDLFYDYFKEAFLKVWYKQCDDDNFNHLICLANLSWRQVALLRAYAKYYRQLVVSFTSEYMSKTLISNYKIATKLVQLFELRFDPSLKDKSDKAKELESKLYLSLDGVSSIDEDRILRQFINLILSTVRTNFYQTGEDGSYKKYISLKFNSKSVLNMPQPQPEYDIFVHSVEFEGVHLRTSKVARGGIRWSDRLHDYRVEVLGLMKAQQVKNPIIVPSGAKGGFVVRRGLSGLSRDDANNVGIHCYKMFISGLLDVVDNLQNGKIIKHENTTCYDDADEYLVVAADKGTAKFSDIANEISQSRDFWLGDAFASGGSTGYDHMAMGITAKGAWVSAERHFLDLNIDLEKDTVTVLGIGDMAGDVFGNGMLLSNQLKLIGAFNHAHIFIDPNPNPKSSFKERKRLFGMPRSSWEDYNKKLISKGGGVFSRQQKSIPVSDQMKKIFNIDSNSISPNDLLRAMLIAEVDMIWNGGIGTFVKSSSENNIEVGDHANDAIRVDGCDVKSRIICEGGNLGLTQLGRIEYEQYGGRLNTDFIDNSAGVDCSDHEVNIKILLDQVVAAGDLSIAERNKLLQEMSDEVSSIVLENNYMQNQTISYISNFSNRTLPIVASYIESLANSGDLNPEIEYLPTCSELQLRSSSGGRLTRPEISVLLAYTKIVLTRAILDSDFDSDPVCLEYVLRAFPERLHDKYRQYIDNHPLKKQIIATQLSHVLVSDVGILFAYQICSELRVKTIDIVKAYVVATRIFDVKEMRAKIKSLDSKILSSKQFVIGVNCFRLIEHAVRWLLRNADLKVCVNDIVYKYRDTAELDMFLPGCLLGRTHDFYLKYHAHLELCAIPKKEMEYFATIIFKHNLLNIAYIAAESSIASRDVLPLYFKISDALQLTKLRNVIEGMPINDQWSAIVKSGFEADVSTALRLLTLSVALSSVSAKVPVIDEWLHDKSDMLDMWRDSLLEYEASSSKDFTATSVLIRRLVEFANMEFASMA